MLDTGSIRHLTLRRADRTLHELPLPLQRDDVIVINQTNGGERAGNGGPWWRSLWTLLVTVLAWLVLAAASVVIGALIVAAVVVAVTVAAAAGAVAIAFFLLFALLSVPLLLALAVLDHSDPRPRRTNARTARPHPRPLRPKPCTEDQPCDLAVRLAFRYPGWDHRGGSRVQVTG